MLVLSQEFLFFLFLNTIDTIIAEIKTDHSASIAVNEGAVDVVNEGVVDELEASVSAGVNSTNGLTLEKFTS